MRLLSADMFGTLQYLLYVLLQLSILNMFEWLKKCNNLGEAWNRSAGIQLYNRTQASCCIFLLLTISQRVDAVQPVQSKVVWLHIKWHPKLRGGKDPCSELHKHSTYQKAMKRSRWGAISEGFLDTSLPNVMAQFSITVLLLLSIPACPSIEKIRQCELRHGSLYDQFIYLFMERSQTVAYLCDIYDSRHALWNHRL